LELQWHDHDRVNCYKFCHVDTIAEALWENVRGTAAVATPARSHFRLRPPAMGRRGPRHERRRVPVEPRDQHHRRDYGSSLDAGFRDDYAKKRRASVRYLRRSFSLGLQSEIILPLTRNNFPCYAK
jgi:hypothetical protein